MGHRRSLDETRRMDREKSRQRSREVATATSSGENAWSRYPQDTPEPPRKKAS